MNKNLTNSILNSGQLYSYQDNYEEIYRKLFKTKTPRANETISKNGTFTDAWVTYRKIQTMWKTQLSMYQRKGTWPSLLSFCQYAWWKNHFDLCTHRTQSHGRKIIDALSRSTEQNRGNQQYQQRIFSTAKIYLGRCHVKCRRPP